MNTQTSLHIQEVCPGALRIRNNEYYGIYQQERPDQNLRISEMPTILIFVESYRFLGLISALQLPVNKDFKTVLDKIKEVASPCTPMWRKLYLFAGSKIALFLFKNQTDLCIVYWKNVTVAGECCKF